MALFLLQFEMDEEAYDRATGFLALNAPFGWQEESLKNGAYRFLLFHQNYERLKDLQTGLQALFPHLNASLEEEEDRDWLSAWRESIQPIVCGPFVVLPPWSVSHPHTDKISVIIEPKNAFGTGQHETTALCLSLLGELAWEKTKTLSPFLDLGTGSGILAIAAARLGLSGLGVDIDPSALENAQENAKRNTVCDRLSFLTGSIETVQGKTFSLIFANILAEPLINLAQDLTKCLADQGLLLLSGLLSLQKERVLSAYQALGLTLQKEAVKGEWSALLLQKS